MDGRRFAEEYIRRQKAAQTGVVIEAGTPSNSGGANGGGWNEVAKGRPQPAVQGIAAVPETNSAFKVVAGKKGKGRR
jgi:PERQ amino acid-rich with GYF domain-containing protein